MEKVIKLLKEFNLFLHNVSFVERIILNSKHFKLVNHVIIIGKQVIYTCRNQKIKPNFYTFQLAIRKTLETELHIAQRITALKS